MAKFEAKVAAVSAYLSRTAFPRHFTAAQRQNLKRYAVNFRLIGGVLYRAVDGKIRKVISTEAQARELFRDMHAMKHGGHSGMLKTRRAVNGHYYWPGMTQDIDRWVAACAGCRRTGVIGHVDPVLHSIKGKLQNWLPPLQKERDAMMRSKQKEEEEYKNMRGNLQAERMKTTAEFEHLRQLLKEQEQTILERLEEMDRKITMVENANIAKLSHQISSLETLMKEIETKCEHSPEELLKDVGLTLSRCENVRFREPQLKIQKNKSMAEGGSQYVDNSLWTASPQQDPPPEVQKAKLGALLKMPLRKGDECYLIDSRWFKQWKKYVGYDGWDMFNMGDRSVHPGPIDNSGLFADHESQALKEHLIDELDYKFVPMEAWEKVVSWYGCEKGQRPIVRKVIEHGLFVKLCKVEVYLPELRLCENSDPDNLKTHRFSKAHDGDH